MLPVMAQTKSKPLVFTHVTVIDATSAEAQSDMVVVVAGGRNLPADGWSCRAGNLANLPRQSSRERRRRFAAGYLARSF